jgi:hypothetical protein
VRRVVLRRTARPLVRRVGGAAVGRAAAAGSEGAAQDSREERSTRGAPRGHDPPPLGSIAPREYSPRPVRVVVAPRPVRRGQRPTRAACCAAGRSKSQPSGAQRGRECARRGSSQSMDVNMRCPHGDVRARQSRVIRPLILHDLVCAVAAPDPAPGTVRRANGRKSLVLTGRARARRRGLPEVGAVGGDAQVP